MKGIDTNVLVRYLIQDDANQSRQANRFIEKELTKESSIFVNLLVLCELVWVLETAYEYPKESIVNVMEHILKTRQFQFDQPDILQNALRGYKEDGADFADHCIAHLNKHYGCESTVTFDKKAARLKHFELLS